MAAPGRKRVLLVIGRFYADIAEQLETGACKALAEKELAWDSIDVPGAFEIPGAVRIAMASGRYDGYVALGCVIRGETTHYDYVCSESARGIMTLAVDHGLAIGYGILTTETHEQAWERAAVDRKNKGRDAVEACCRLMALRARFRAEA